MNPESLGRAISEATKFLLTIHDDLRYQIRSLDRLMADLGWKPTDPNRLGYDLGNSINDPKLWVADYLQRGYVRREAEKVADRFIALIWYLYFDAGDVWEVPTITAVAAQLDSPKLLSDLPGSDWQIGTVHKVPGRNLEPVELTNEQARSFLSDIRSATALIMPLCEMTNERVLEQRLIGPILAAEARLERPTKVEPAMV